MMKHGKQIIRNYMTLEYEFSGIRMQDAYLCPVDWVLNVKLIAPEKRGRSREDSELKAGTTFQKLYFWLDTNLPNVVIADVSKENDLYIANLSGNIMMYCPGSTSDDMVIQLLHSKLTALAGKELVVGEIQLKGSDTTMQYTFDAEDHLYAMPDTTAEYYTEGSARDSIPWWNRDDGFCFEFIRPEKSKLPDNEVFKDISDPLDEFYRIMAEDSESSFGIVKEPARIVQVEKWKPKKID